MSPWIANLGDGLGVVLEKNDQAQIVFLAFNTLEHLSFSISLKFVNIRLFLSVIGISVDNNVLDISHGSLWALEYKGWLGFFWLSKCRGTQMWGSSCQIS